MFEGSSRLAGIDLSSTDAPTVGPRGTPELFTYGTLQIEKVAAILIDRVPKSRVANAEGWRAAKLPELPYPGLVADSRSSAPGRVYSDLSETELLTLDAFENPNYLVEIVRLDDDSRALAYVWPGAVITESWSLSSLDAEDSSGYFERCQRWRDRYRGTR